MFGNRMILQLVRSTVQYVHRVTSSEEVLRGTRYDVDRLCTQRASPRMGMRHGTGAHTAATD